MSEKLDVPLESLRLDLLESHREHCPWKNAEVQGTANDGPIANMPAWQTLQFMILGRSKDVSTASAFQTPSKTTPRKQHNKGKDSVDIGSDIEYPRGSLDSEERDEEGGASLKEKWSKLKAKLKRTASKKSLKSTKSVKSMKSAKSVVGKAGEKEKS